MAENPRIRLRKEKTNEMNKWLGVLDISKVTSNPIFIASLVPLLLLVLYLFYVLPVLQSSVVLEQGEVEEYIKVNSEQQIQINALQEGLQIC